MFSDIKIIADLQRCQYISEKRINVELPDPLAQLKDSVLNIDELQKKTGTKANLDLLRKLKKLFIYSNRKLRNVK